MILLFDIGNTHTHLALASVKRILRRLDVPTELWFEGRGGLLLTRFARGVAVSGAAMCSVVPRATARVKQALRSVWRGDVVEVRPRNLPGVKVDYPQPSTIGADRLANAVAARHRYGAPVVALDFGTALTIDVVNSRACYIGGVIAPGLAAMTNYLRERTALLPRISLRATRRVIGRSTVEAMRIGVVRGYGGLVRELLGAVLNQPGCAGARVVATGGYARLIASQLPEIQIVDPMLTLEGVRLVWEWNCTNRPNAKSRKGEKAVV